MEPCPNCNEPRPIMRHPDDDSTPPEVYCRPCWRAALIHGCELSGDEIARVLTELVPA